MPRIPHFLPSTRAPLFSNTRDWPPDAQLNVAIQGLPPVDVGITGMALCGGMAFLTRDIFDAGAPQLRSRNSPRIPAALAEHIFARLLVSFSGPGVVDRWINATRALDHDTALLGPGLYHQSVNECPTIVDEVDAGNLCPIGIVLTQSWAPWAVFDNHVVLVYGYEWSGEVLGLQVYDPNHPGLDSIEIVIDTSNPTQSKTISTNGTSNPDAQDTIRGFFALPYYFADPAPAYIDDAILNVVGPVPVKLAPGERAEVVVHATNRGSTSWSPLSYRLGSVRDGATWGLARVALSQPTDPDHVAAFVFNITAPGVRGRYRFEWGMVHEPRGGFGTATARVDIAVGLNDPACALLAVEESRLAHELAAVRLAMDALDPHDPLSRAEMKELARYALDLSEAIRRNEQQQKVNGCVP